MIRTAPEGRWFIIGAWVVALALIGVAVARTLGRVDRRGRGLGHRWRSGSSRSSATPSAPGPGATG